MAIFSADLLQGRAVGAEPVGHDRLRLAVFSHRFPEEFQRRIPVARLRDEAFQHLAFVIDRAPKVISYTVGDRSQATAREFMFDLAGRLATRIQLTTDGHGGYLKAVTDAFSGDVDYAMLIKQYGDLTGQKGHERKYSPAECTGAKKEAIFGKPDMDQVGTSHIERQNLTMRMGMRRFTRLTNAFSKKAESHAYAVALHFMHYNYCRIHKTLRITPAMAANFVASPWSVDDIVALAERAESEAAPKKRGPYKKRSSAT